MDKSFIDFQPYSPWQTPSIPSALTPISTSLCPGIVQFNSHLFLIPIGAWTLEMPVPYPPPSVGACTQTPSHQPLVFDRKDTDHLP